jgi:hypothetical protein
MGDRVSFRYRPRSGSDRSFPDADVADEERGQEGAGRPGNSSEGW